MAKEPQRQYTFTGNDGTKIQVTATSERNARFLAMTKRWGRTPQNIGSPAVIITTWQGNGLTLDNTSDAPNTDPEPPEAA